MRNFRKTKKRGGMILSTVLECVPPFQTLSKCTKEFVKRENFKVIEVPDDGNCFYHTLAKYYQLSKSLDKTPTHKQLRQIVVGKIENDIDRAKNSIIINKSNIPNNILYENEKAYEMAKYLEALDELREDGVWDSDTSDIVSQYAAKALNLEIKIYDMREARSSTRKIISRPSNSRPIYQNIPAEPAKIICYTFKPEIDKGTIHMFRVTDSHYKLLYPKDATSATGTTSATGATKGRRITSKKPAVSNNAVNAVKTNKTLKSPTTRSKAKNKIILSNANKPKKVIPRRRSTVKLSKKNELRNRTSSLENDLMKIAFQESKIQSNRGKPLNDTFFNALDSVNFE